MTVPLSLLFFPTIKVVFGATLSSPFLIGFHSSQHQQIQLHCFIHRIF